MTSTFEDRFGFPRDAVNLANWRTQPYSSWSFQNVGEIVPSARIAVRANSHEPPLADASGLLREKVGLADGPESIGDFLARSKTESLVVMKSGRVVADHHAASVDATRPHIVFSISKSLTAIMAGILEDEGKLDPAAPVMQYLPEMRNSAFADASVQNVLDMRVSLDFEEIYLDPLSAFGRYRRAMQWNPALPGEEPETMTLFLASLQKGSGEHGGPFNYLSPNSDLLGVIVERASGQRYADFLGERVLKPAGALTDGWVTVDRVGTARAAGGVSLTARDLARVGEMLRIGGKGVVSSRWIEDTLQNGDPAAWAGGSFPHLFPNGRYRNKWYSSGDADGSFCAIGIHGQWLYVNPARETVIVRYSCQDVPVDDPIDLDSLKVFDVIARR